jgi:DNA-binding response OmpR family regulator
MTRILVVEDDASIRLGLEDTRTVDNHLVKLRKALEDDPERPRYLVTVHGAGYRLNEEA